MYTEFKYEGGSFTKTRDYVINIGNMIILVDFTVTNGDPGRIRDSKISKYSELGSGYRST